MPLHPQTKSFLEALAEQSPPGWDEMSPDEGRALFNGLTELFGPAPDVERVEDVLLDDRIPARLYANSRETLPVVMYFHGGGWVLGDLESHDALCRQLAIHSGCAVVSVDYRRAPEHPFPTPLEDCYDATAIVTQQGATLGVDASRLAVAGDSAGGNLAAAVALRSREMNGPTIHSQWLLYPVIDRNFETASYREFAEGFALTRRSMMWFWDQYVGADIDSPDPLAAPARASSLHGLPPAHVVTAEFDVLRDEGEAYAARLKESGVPVTRRRYDGNIHGFIQFCGVFDDGKTAIADLGHLIRKGFNQ